MANYKDSNNIQFNSVDVAISGNNKKWGQAELANATNEDLIEIASDNGGNLPTIINAVEIDWNGAVLPNSNTSFGTSITINTTGEIFRGSLRGS